MNTSESKNAIFAKIETATAALKTRVPLPDYDVTITHSLPKLEGSDLWEIFCRNFKSVNGKAMSSVDELAAFDVSQLSALETQLQQQLLARRSE